MCICFTGDGFHNFVLKCSTRIYLMHLEWVDLLTKLQDVNLGPSHPLKQCWYVENSPARKWRFGHWKMNVFFQGVIFRFQALVVWGNTCPNKKVGSVCVLLGCISDLKACHRGWNIIWPEWHAWCFLFVFIYPPWNYHSHWKNDAWKTLFPFSRIYARKISYIHMSINKTYWNFFAPYLWPYYSPCHVILLNKTSFNCSMSHGGLSFGNAFGLCFTWWIGLHLQPQQRSETWALPSTLHRTLHR